MGTLARSGVAVCIAIFAAGCASTPATRTSATQASASENETAPETAPETTPAANADSAPRPSRAPGPLTRSEAREIVDRGLGVILARVQLTPMVDAGRFLGFRLDSAQDLEAWRAAGADIRVGDVIVRVNGIRVERPQQALWAFERLRVVPQIEAEVVRGAERVVVRSAILDPG